jgi:hypothetical protein
MSSSIVQVEMGIAPCLPLEGAGLNPRCMDDPSVHVGCCSGMRASHEREASVGRIPGQAHHLDRKRVP